MSNFFLSQHPRYEYLRKKWIAKNRQASSDFLSKHSQSLRHLTLGGLGGLMLVGTPGSPIIASNIQTDDGVKILKTEDKNALLAQALKETVPDEVRKLSDAEEDKITKILAKELGIDVESEIDGIRLNRSFGLIGGEQHLYRYPGDHLFKHADSATDWAMFGSAGIAPHLGAWGYFAPSKDQLTVEDKEKERFYIAVQTFLAPGFAENVDKFRDFFKYRKMLVVNPQTGQAVITVIGDAGPAEWTGKHLGGSPEVMHYLGLSKGMRKGTALYFFINDLENKVPLGPISVNKIES